MGLGESVVEVGREWGMDKGEVKGLRKDDWVKDLRSRKDYRGIESVCVIIKGRVKGWVDFCVE